MKSGNSILMIPVAIVLLLSGCVSDTNEPGTGPENGSTITFSLPGINKGGITYVETVGDEAKIEYLDIFMFDDATGTLESIYRNIKVEAPQQPPAASTATIDVTEKEGAKKFFFIGNGKDITSELDMARYGETTVAQFLEMMSDKQATLPTTPLLMTGRGAVSDVANPTGDEKKIQLVRRVARFDIDNTTTHATEPDKSSNIVITQILVGNVSKQAYLFGDALGNTPGKSIETENADPIDFGTQTKANEGETPAVFYIYPSTLGEGKTEISMLGTYKGNVRTIVLKAPKDFAIEANKRYILKPVKITVDEIIAEITVKDWEDGATWETQPGKNTVSATDLKVDLGNGVLTGTKLDRKTTYDMTGKAGASKFSFTTTAYRATGTKANIRYLKGTFDDLPVTINNPDPTLTYAARYEQDYVVEVANKSLAKNVYAEVEVEIINVYDPIQILSFKIVSNEYLYPTEAGNIDAVLVGGTWFAPVNVGAKLVNGAWNNPDNNGLLFQWGRDNVGWKYNDTENAVIVNGPSTEADAKESKAFIKGAGSYLDWIDVQNDNLWSGDKRKGPCPDGWRVPTQAEMQKLVNILGTASAQNGNIRFTGDISAKYLFMPASTGYRNQNGGYAAQASNNSNDYGYYWTSDMSGTNYSQGFTVRHSTPASTALTGNWQRSRALAVRCVVDK